MCVHGPGWAANSLKPSFSEENPENLILSVARFFKISYQNLLQSSQQHPKMSGNFPGYSLTAAPEFLVSSNFRVGFRNFRPICTKINAGFGKFLKVSKMLKPNLSMSLLCQAESFPESQLERREKFALLLSIISPCGLKFVLT